MKLSKLAGLILVMTLINTIVFAQSVPKQKDIVKNNIPAFFAKLPSTVASMFLSSTKFDDFALIANEHAKYKNGNKLNSPFSKVFGANASKRLPLTQNSLPFYNSSSDMAEVVQSDYGFCAGFSVVMRQLNMLAFFDPNNQFDALPDGAVKGNEIWVKFFKHQLDLIMTGQPALIPMYANLNAFASEEVFGKYIKQLIVKAWAELNVSFKGLHMLSSVKRKSTPEKLKKLIAEIELAHSMNYNPIVYASAPNKTVFNPEQWIHVLQVFKVNKLAGGKKVELFVWDPNVPAANQLNFPNVLGLDLETGAITYQSFRDLAEIGVLPYETAVIGKIVSKTLKSEFCLKYTLKSSSNKIDDVSICSARAQNLKY